MFRIFLIWNIYIFFALLYYSTLRNKEYNKTILATDDTNNALKYQA